jgi:putative zinc finger/helix-turn-helix YgiT family protein
MASCYRCGHARLVARRATVEYPQAGLPYPVLLVDLPVRECPSCGERALSIPDVEGLHLALAVHVARANRALLAPELRFLRRYLGWSAEHLSTVMGVDPKTLSRWENGRQRPGPVAERLLRLLILQQRPEDGPAVVDRVLSGLGREPTETTASIRLSTSRRGWREAA